MLTEAPGSDEIRILIEALHSHASELRSRHETEFANYFDKVASNLVIGPGGETPLRDFVTYINHPKGFIDEQPSTFSRSEWRTIGSSLRKKAHAALTSNGWSPGILIKIKQALWPF
ncbi:hypothetical protein [Geothrix sp. SG200]|uniref:hypothetical protein n=1 Tax=Geothrix sp. SG200 TaxID=2922865 RepID=UPI001FAB42B8|nr:hypothetical protein [Geothrix sp. SG200]